MSRFFELGSLKDQINVEISFQIIALFSEGLYSSPNKAIEELVSNAFDADATCVHTGRCQWVVAMSWLNASVGVR